MVDVHMPTADADTIEEEQQTGTPPVEDWGSDVNQDPVIRAELATLLNWWVPALGLRHWRILAAHTPDIDSVARAWRSNHYNAVSLQFRERDSEEKAWRDWPREESVVHELLHTLFRDYDAVVDNMIVPALPKASQAMAAAAFDHWHEQITESVANIMVALRHCAPDGDPPEIGYIKMPTDIEQSRAEDGQPIPHMP